MNNNGKHQAILAGRRLKEENVVLDAMWSSDLKRCVETSKLILENSPRDENGQLPEIVLDQGLRERAMGDLEGMSIGDATARCEKEGKTFHDYGESRKQAVSRLNQTFDAIVDESLKKHYHNIMIVSHGGVVSKFIYHLVTDRGFRLSSSVTMKHLKVPHNTSFTKVIVDESTRQGVVESFGDASHLEVNIEADQQAL